MPDQTPITIAVDAMGGDHAPDEVVRAAAELSLHRSSPGRGRHPGGSERPEAPLQIILVGDGPRIGALLHTLPHDAERLIVHHTPHSVAMGGGGGVGKASGMG